MFIEETNFFEYWVALKRAVWVMGGTEKGRLGGPMRLEAGPVSSVNQRASPVPFPQFLLS